jgi:hypothetical protein
MSVTKFVALEKRLTMIVSVSMTGKEIKCRVEIASLQGISLLQDKKEWQNTASPKMNIDFVKQFTASVCFKTQWASKMLPGLY